MAALPFTGYRSCGGENQRPWGQMQIARVLASCLMPGQQVNCISNLLLHQIIRSSRVCQDTFAAGMKIRDAENAKIVSSGDEVQILGCNIVTSFLSDDKVDECALGS